MREFTYETEGYRPLKKDDQYKLFNNYRTSKYIIEMLALLNKTHLSEYKILEPGCGSGGKLRLFTEFRARPDHCFGFDLSKRAMDIAKRNSPQGVNFQVASAMEMPFKQHMFDLIICSALLNCFLDTHDISRISRELRRVIKDNGVLLVVEITEHFSKIVFNDRDYNRGFKMFDTSKNELENILGDEFIISRRDNLFLDAYIVGDKGERRWANIKELPLIDSAIDDGKIPCSYCLYSFLPRH